MRCVRFSAVDSGERDRVPESVRERESGRDCGSGDYGYDGKYAGGCGVL